MVTSSSSAGVMAPSPQAFSELLRQKWHEARLTQENLAARSGLAARTISDLERGLVAAPRWDTLQQLVRGLGLQMAGLDCCAAPGDSAAHGGWT